MAKPGDNLFVNSKMTDFMYKMGVTALADEQCSPVISITSNSLFKMYNELNTSDCALRENANKLYDVLSNQSGSGFTGGTPADFKQLMDGKMDLTRFIDARNKLTHKLNGDELVVDTLVRKRKRIMSEYDGEFDFDRMWERQPFYDAKVINDTNAKIIDVYCSFGFHSDIDQNFINDYGAYCWSLIDALEKNGAQCNVYIVNKVNNPRNGMFSQPSVTTPACLINELYYWISKVKIKSSEEYIDTLDIARCFTSLFYRMGIFGFWTAACDGMKIAISPNMGTPDISYEATEIKKGYIFLTAAAFEDNPTLDNLQEIIKKVL